MQEVTTWDYAESVKTMKVMVMKWSTMTVEMVAGLYKAREELAARGSGKIDVPNGTSKTWTGYLSEVGLARTTVHNWLERYEPTENKLITVEELETRKAQEERAKRNAEMSERQKLSARVDGYMKTGCKPINWTDKEESIYQENMEQKRVNTEFLRITKEKEDARIKESQERQKRMEDLDRQISGFDFSAMAERLTKQVTQRSNFKESIRISHEGKEDPFVDAIMDYLDTLEDDNRRIEACYNIIKVCKGIANQIQSGSNK